MVSAVLPVQGPGYALTAGKLDAAGLECIEHVGLLADIGQTGQHLGQLHGILRRLDQRDLENPVV